MQRVKLSFRMIQKHYNNLCISKLFTYPKFLKTLDCVKSYYMILIIQSDK